MKSNNNPKNFSSRYFLINFLALALSRKQQRHIKNLTNQKE